MTMVALSEVVSGTCRDQSMPVGMDSLIFWAQFEGWQVRYYPVQGGSQGYYREPGIGFVVDTCEMMPPDVWDSLLGLLKSWPV